MKKKLFVAAFACVLALLSGCASTRPMAKGPAADPSLSLVEKLDLIGLPKTPITRPRVWYNGNEWRDHVTEMVREAKHYVVITSFLASNSLPNADFYQALVDKANEGVPVYFLVDGSGLFDMTESRKSLIPLMYLTHTPIHFLETKPISAARLVGATDFLFRYHQKVVIIDGKMMAIGGMNFNYISVGAPPGRDLQRDTMYEFTSPEAVKAFLEWFVPWWNDQSWDRISLADFPIDATYRQDEPKLDAWLVNEVPGTHVIGSAFGALLSSAKESVEILPFLPALDGNMMKAIRETVARGVKVSMVISYDKRTSDRYMYLPLLEAGVDMRIEPPSEKGLLHEKLMIVDNRYVLVGSSNFNVRSMALSYEIGMIIDDPQLASLCRQHYQELYEQADYVSPQEAASWRTFGKMMMHLLMTVGG